MNNSCKNNSPKKKMSVITSYYICNYGSVLQAYATKLFFEQIGYEVEFVNYIRENVRNRIIINPKWSSKKKKKAIYKLYQKIDTNKKKKVFERYIAKHLQLSAEYPSKNELYKNPPEADVYCVGSDQMWNSEYNDGILPEVFLDYAPSGSKKISFSSSMGMSVYSKEDLYQMKTYLENFLFISVREKEAVDILSKAGVKNIQLFLDPTLLIPAQTWINVMSLKKRKKNYILIYQLNDNPKMLHFAIKLAEKNNLQIIQITYYMFQKIKGVHCIYCPKVCEFLSLFYHAEYVVTDSFHGTAFSINLNKKFYAFNPPKYNSRIKSILDITGLNTRLIDKTDEVDFDTPINYIDVNLILEKERINARTQLNILTPL